MTTAIGEAALAPAAGARPVSAVSAAHWRRAAVIGIAMFFVLAAVDPVGLLNDSDTIWHVTVGYWILEHRALPHVDIFSYTMRGEPWIAKEWLSQALYALAHRTFGWTGVVLLATASVALTFVILARYLLTRTSPIATYLMLASAFVLSIQHMLARPHCLGYPMMLAWFCGLSRASEEGRRPSFWLLPVMLLWANLHSSFTFGLLAAGGFALDAVLRADRRERVTITVQWGVFLALSLAAACATPYGAESILMTRKIYELGDALGRIYEWQPTNFRDSKLIAAVLMLWLLAALWFRPPLPLGRVLLAVLITYMALQATRNMELFGFLMPIVVAGTVGLRVSPDSAPFLPRISGAVFAGIGVLLTSAAVLALANKNVAPSETLLVTKALDEARDRGLLQKPVFNSYGLGGQMIARGVPTFVDGRAELYGQKFLLEYLDAITLSGTGDPLRMLDRYKVEWTLLEPGTPTVQLLDARPEWRRVFADKNTVIHVRDLAKKAP